MNEQKALSLSEIGQISVNVHDFDRAVAFYKETLGIKHLFSVPGRMAFFDCSGLRLMLAIPERPDLDHPSSILYFKVKDIEAAHAALDFTRSAFRNQTNAGRADGDLRSLVGRIS